MRLVRRLGIRVSPLWVSHTARPPKPWVRAQVHKLTTSWAYQGSGSGLPAATWLRRGGRVSPQGSPGLQFWSRAACPVWFRSGPSVPHSRLRLGEHAPLLEAPRSLVAAFAPGSPDTTATPHVSTCGPLWPCGASPAAWPPPPQARAGDRVAVPGTSGPGASPSGL